MRESLATRLERVILRPVPTSRRFPNLEAINRPTYVVTTPRNFRLAPKGPKPALPPSEPRIKAWIPAVINPAEGPKIMNELKSTTSAASNFRYIRIGKGNCKAGGTAADISAARAPNVALPAITVVGLSTVREVNTQR